MKKKPDLSANEEVVLEGTGFYKDNLRSGWKPGHLYLTNQRLFLWQPAKTIFQTPLKNITGISIQQRGFVLRSKDALCISYLRARPGLPANRQMGQQPEARAWIMVKDIETWKDKIFERSLLEIDQDGIEKIAKELDPESKNILLFVWQNRHASIGELATVYDAPNHMDVLHRIRNVINPTGERAIGFPVLVFERNKIDEANGKKVTFSWWIIGGDKLKEDKEEALLDIFDEGDYLNVIMELKGAQEEDILLGVDEDKLTISCITPQARYHEEVPLPAKVDNEGIARKYHNNILEVRLEKAEDRRQRIENRYKIGEIDG